MHLVTIALKMLFRFSQNFLFDQQKEVFDLVSIIFLQAQGLHILQAWKSMDKTPIFALWMLKETIMSSFQKYWYRFLMRKE